MKWLAPEIEVTIGARTRSGTVERMEICAARTQPVATAYLDLSNVRFEWNNWVTDGDPIKLRWGWRGQELQPLFDGSVIRAQLRESLKVWALCRARALADTRITRTYHKEEAAAIATHLVDGLGFSGVDIAAGEQLMDKLPLKDNSVIEALDFLTRRLNLDHEYYCDPEGVFHCGPRDYEQEEAATFTHGEDIIELTAAPGGRFLLSAMATPIWHSQVVGVYGYDGRKTRYFVEQVRHSVGVNGQGARSQFWLEEIR